MRNGRSATESCASEDSADREESSSSCRAVVLPGLAPLTPHDLQAIVAVEDEPLELAARICEFDPAQVVGRLGGAPLESTVHEALLAVAVIRRLHREQGRWTVFCGSSAGYLTAMLGAGVITMESCFRLIREINGRQTRNNRGSTIIVLALSASDAHHLAETICLVDDTARLSIDFGAGLVGISVGGEVTDSVHKLLNRLSIFVVDILEAAQHCPYAEPNFDEFSVLTKNIEFLSTPSTVLSPITGQPVEDDPENYRQTLIEQWYEPASIPRLMDGLCGFPGVEGVDVISPEKSVFVTRLRTLLQGRIEHDLMAIPS